MTSKGPTRRLTKQREQEGKDTKEKEQLKKKEGKKEELMQEKQS